MRPLRDRVAIVTGASSGLGPYLARALAGEGMRLVLAARSAEPLARVAAELTASGAVAIAVPTDVTRAADREALVQRATREMGAVDLLVNNAGVENASAFEEITAEEVAQLIDVNLTAAISLTRVVIPGMLERRRGHVLNMGSLASKGCPPYLAPYAASKAGLVAFTRSLRAEYRSRGVSASVIVPGFVSDAGMYHRNTQVSGRRSTKLLGEVTPAQVVKAMLRAIQGDRSEIIVNPGPMRLFCAISELYPGFTEWASHNMGGAGVLKSFVEANKRAGKR